MPVPRFLGHPLRPLPPFTSPLPSFFFFFAAFTSAISFLFFFLTCSHLHTTFPFIKNTIRGQESARTVGESHLGGRRRRGEERFDRCCKATSGCQMGGGRLRVSFLLHTHTHTPPARWRGGGSRSPRCLPAWALADSEAARGGG